MTEHMQYAEDDPRHRTAMLRDMLAGAVRHAREDIGELGDPQARALLETTAEVCIGLTTALEHYENKSEPAWQ